MSGQLSVSLQKRGGSEVIWLTLPVTEEDFKLAMQKIGATHKDEFVISGFQSNVRSLPSEAIVAADFNSVNYLASQFVAMSNEQLEALKGFDLWQKLYLMKFTPEQYCIADKPENYLTTAEMSSEANYNMIDGLINNEPTKQNDPDKKNSILDQLNQGKEPQQHKEPYHTDRVR